MHYAFFDPREREVGFLSRKFGLFQMGVKIDESG